MITYDAIISALILGSYGFTWAVYKVLDKKFNEILTNHLKHVREDIENLEIKVDKHKEDYDRRTHFPS